MKKYEKIIIIFLVLVGMYFIGKTIYNTIQKQESIIAEQQSAIDSLSMRLAIMEAESEITKEDFDLLVKHYCASENLFDTIFYYFINDGIFMFQYEPYSQISNEIYEYETLYKFLEETRKIDF